MKSQSIRNIAKGEQYTLIRKKVKNINLRVKDDLNITVSAPMGVSAKYVDNLVLSRLDWINTVRQRIAARTTLQPPIKSDEECLLLFKNISGRIYPLFTDVLKEPPEITVKLMKSRWGVCYPSKGLIVLNKMLADMPLEAVEYVIMHEYVHFIHLDHQQGFHKLMAQLMPDYKQRRKLLKGYTQ